MGYLSETKTQESFDVTKFDLEEKIPSCKVTKALLESLEKYIFDRKEEITKQLGTTPSWDDFEITITDNLGKESIGSTQKLNERFFPSTKKVEISSSTKWNNENKLRLNISFSNESFSRSTITITSTSRSARELTVGMHDSLNKLIQTNKTSSWFFHPGRIDVFIFLVAFVIILAGFLAEFSFEMKYAFGRCLLFGIAIILYLWFGPKLHPYITFDSPSADNLRAVSNLFKVALLGFLLSAFIYPLLFKLIKLPFNINE